jgi:DNA-binding transcriptional MerR regulator
MYRPGQVAADLNISPVQLKKLTERFARLLSSEASDPNTLENGRKANRTYTDADIATLNAILELQEQGMSDEALEQHMLNLPDEVETPLAIVSSREYDDMFPPQAAAAAIGQALQQISDTQQALLNSQQSQRDLLSVVINDAMAIKDENDRLRKRLRTMEEELSRIKESEMNYRLSLEERLNRVERETNDKKSWWSRLTGK